MIESDLVSELITEGGSLTGIRIGRDTHVKAHVRDHHSRTVFLVDDLVLKFASEGPYDQGFMEAMLWHDIALEDRKYFIEITSTGALTDKNGIKWRWVAQKFVHEVADPPGDLSAEVISKATKKVQELATRYEIDDLVSREYKRNWTILAATHEPLIFDYGIVPKYQKR